MAIQMAVGREDFEAIIRSGQYYVDKTELLYDLAEKTGNEVTLFTRPRRFGKTLNMSMMKCFFDITRDSRDLFEGLAVTQHEEFCREWMNQYPVLFISFKDVDGLDFVNAFSQLQTVIAEYCKTIGNLVSKEGINSADRIIFQRLMNNDASLSETKFALKTIMRIMNAVYGKPVILLIDEYDVPLAKASEKNTPENHYYEQMLDLIRGIMSISLKTNEYLKFAVVTGCLRIAKESIFTGTNNFVSYSVLDEEFSEYFGFTHQEVDQLLTDAGCSMQAPIVKEWYDGYLFGDTPVYCPWDVVNYVSRLLRRGVKEPKNYWLHTSSNSVIREFAGRYEVTNKFEILMNGGAIIETITDQLTYDLLRESEQNLWSILLMTGYLTKADPREKGDTVSLKIPNAEIAGVFQETVASLFKETLDLSRQKTLMDALWSGDEETASRIMSDFLWDTISYMDYHENYYHAFLAGLFVGRGYETESNKEAGLGRPDLQLFDRKNRRVMIMEIKRSGSQEQMQTDCEAALEQIRERDYAKGLDPGYRTVLCYGISFYRKTALVKQGG